MWHVNGTEIRRPNGGGHKMYKRCMRSDVWQCLCFERVRFGPREGVKWSLTTHSMQLCACKRLKALLSAYKRLQVPKPPKSDRIVVIESVYRRGQIGAPKIILEMYYGTLTVHGAKSCIF